MAPVASGEAPHPKEGVPVPRVKGTGAVRTMCRQRLDTATARKNAGDATGQEGYVQRPKARRHHSRTGRTMPSLCPNSRCSPDPPTTAKATASASTA